MERDEDAEFSSAMLLVAIAIYVSVFAGTLAGLVAMKDSAGDAFLSWTKDYGAIIAGFPVLIAVWVAKQQLDANRRQHAATIKRSFKAEMDALWALDEFSSRVMKTSFERALITASLAEMHGIFLPSIPSHQLEGWRSHVSNSTFLYADWTRDAVESAMRCSELGISGREEAIKSRIKKAQELAANLREKVQDELHHLEQYWS